MNLGRCSAKPGVACYFGRVTDRSEIWQGLLTARLSCMYFAEERKSLTKRLTAFSVLSGLTALSSVATVLGKWPLLASVLVVVSAASTVYVQASKLSDRIARAAALVESWKSIEVDWFEAWRHVERTGVAPTNIGELRRSVIPRQKEESEFSYDEKRLRRLQLRVEESFGIA